jgi:hypothetical protein
MRWYIGWQRGSRGIHSLVSVKLARSIDLLPLSEPVEPSTSLLVVSVMFSVVALPLAPTSRLDNFFTMLSVNGGFVD